MLHISEVKLTGVTIHLSLSQIRRLLACIEEQGCTADTSDLALAFEALLLLALVSDDTRTDDAIQVAIRDADIAQRTSMFASTDAEIQELIQAEKAVRKVKKNG